jgi:hypothetical protein
MTSRDQFLSRLSRYCRKNSLDFEFDAGRGKGSHGRIRVGDRTTIVKSGELSPLYIGLVLKQLGLSKDALEG